MATRILLLSTLVLTVVGSPKGVPITEGLEAFDEDCFGDDHRKICGIKWNECNQQCSRDIQCSAFVYNYKEGEGGSHASWDDGCCWLKKACSKVKKMNGKRRAVIRLSNHVPKQVSQLQELLRHSGPDDVKESLNEVLSVFSADDIKTEVSRWITKTRRKLETKEEPPEQPTQFLIPKLTY